MYADDLQRESRSQDFRDSGFYYLHLFCIISSECKLKPAYLESETSLIRVQNSTLLMLSEGKAYSMLLLLMHSIMLASALFCTSLALWTLDTALVCLSLY